MTLFDYLLLRMLKAGHISRRATVVVRHYMRAYRHAAQHPEVVEPPPVPRMVQASLRLATVVALFRLSVEQPPIFVLGCLCVLPAIVLFLLTLARWSAKGIGLVMGGIPWH